MKDLQPNAERTPFSHKVWGITRPLVAALGVTIYAVTSTDAQQVPGNEPGVIEQATGISAVKTNNGHRVTREGDKKIVEMCGVVPIDPPIKLPSYVLSTTTFETDTVYLSSGEIQTQTSFNYTYAPNEAKCGPKPDEIR